MLSSLRLSSPVASLWNAYEHQLRRRPLATQSATSAAIWFTGDVVAQKLTSSGAKFNGRRSALTALFGGGLVAPAGHAWYQLIDKLALKLARAQSLRFLLFKLAADIAVYTPAQMAAFFLFGSLCIDGSGLSGFCERMAHDFAPSYAVSAVGWPPAMAVVFSRIPLEHQLLAVNLLSLGETTFLSWVLDSDFDAIAQQLSAWTAAAGLPAALHLGQLLQPPHQQQQQLEQEQAPALKQQPAQQQLQQHRAGAPTWGARSMLKMPRTARSSGGGSNGGGADGASSAAAAAAPAAGAEHHMPEPLACAMGCLGLYAPEPMLMHAPRSGPFMIMASATMASNQRGKAAGGGGGARGAP